MRTVCPLMIQLVGLISFMIRQQLMRHTQLCIHILTDRLILSNPQRILLTGFKVCYGDFDIFQQMPAFICLSDNFSNELAEGELTKFDGCNEYHRSISSMNFQVRLSTSKKVKHILNVPKVLRTFCKQCDCISSR